MILNAKDLVRYTAGQGGSVRPLGDLLHEPIVLLQVDRQIRLGLLADFGQCFGVFLAIYGDADDIDGVTYVAGASGIAPGTFIDVRLDDVVDDVDFSATYLRVVSSPATRLRPTRALPVMTSVGSFGR